MTAPSRQPLDIVDLADRVASQRVEQDVGRENERPLPPLPKSISGPMLLPGTALYPPATARRTKSELGLGEALKLPKQRGPARDIANEPCDPEAAAASITVPSLHVQEPTVTKDGAVASTSMARVDELDEEPHLQHMDISHQLRSMSQLSDPVEDDVSLMSGNPWNFHHRERSGVGFESSARSRHSRVKSSTGMNSAAVPSAWGRVRSPTAASSIYSRPTSAAANAGDEATDEPERPPYTVPMDLNALFADWPLRPSGSSDGSASKTALRNKPPPPPPSDKRKDSAPGSFATAKDKDDADTQWLCPPGTEAGVPRTSSSSIISGSSKKSRFLERFSPPKRLVRKRRSIFKFLRPASRKQQARSISSPILSAKLADAAYDGPSDDPALLTVQYELVEQPQHTARSASMNQLNPMRQSVSTNELPAPPPHLQRSPTLADYERNLSIMGDDRRRPSSMNLTRLNEIQEEDRRESIGIRRKLSRAKELKDDASPLMAQALTKHQQEKDMFRSSSKRRETERASRSTPVFSAPTFGTMGSSLAPTPEVEVENELLDPLQKAESSSVAGRENSATYLSPLTAAGPSRRASSVAPAATPSTIASSLQLKAREASVPPATPSRPKIGTSLASWSRYPSHTRFERSGSAGRGDNVITRDFAIEIDPDGLRASDESESGSIGPHAGTKTSPRKQTKRLQKSRSLTFGSIVRYYNNLFHTSGWAGQNRRTSVTLGGKLERPELEMLPPHVSDERKHEHDTLKHLKDIVKEDAERVREFVVEEEGKIEKFVEEEEQKIGRFVEEEEDKIEGFVRKEEGKIMKFVREEEDRWMPHHHHQQQQQHQHEQKLDELSTGLPFRHGSIFRADRHHPSNDSRQDTTIGPNDDEQQVDPIKNVQDPATDALAPNALHLDGTATATSPTQAGLPPSGPSKAELWSNIYQDCIVRPPSAHEQPARSESMPPPLGPAMMKPRIRRFPSVTVVDDRKGHWRSVSLISVKTSRS